MSTNDRLHVYSYTGAFVGTNIANSVASFFQKTVENTIYNTNANGVILNGDSSSPTTLLESGYKIQLAGKTYVEDDMTFVANKSVTTSGSGRFVGDLNGNADTVTNGVYLTATQTVTNKSISGSTNTRVKIESATAATSASLYFESGQDRWEIAVASASTGTGNALSGSLVFRHNLSKFGNLIFTLFNIFICLFIINCSDNNNKVNRPNIIVIMADDLGYGDLSIYGNKTIQTPNIDLLGNDGLIMTDFHSNGTVCSPTRAALLTGKYQHRVGVKGVITVSYTHLTLPTKRIV